MTDISANLVDILRTISILSFDFNDDLDLEPIRRKLFHDTGTQDKVNFNILAFNCDLDFGRVKTNLSKDTSTCVGEQVCKVFSNPLINVEVMLQTRSV